MAKLFKIDGTITEVHPKGRVFTGEELHELVGGYIEGISLGGGRWMFVDEEGNLKNLPYNAVATAELFSIIGPCVGLVGDVVLCEKGEVE